MPAPLAGRVCVVTGANSGIGLETARGLAALGARVVMACRDAHRGEAARADVVASTGHPAVELRLLDLASLASVRAFAADLLRDHPRLHVLGNNAGTYERRRHLTADGLERTFQVNHLGPFLLTHLLLPALRAGAPARIVNVASEAGRWGRLHFGDLQLAQRWSGPAAYMQSKLANIACTFELARRLEGTGVTANAMHPGIVATRWASRGGGAMTVGVWLARPIARTAAQGADTAVWLASAPEVAGVTGKYWDRRRERPPPRASRDPAAQRRLWEECERLAGLA